MIEQVDLGLDMVICKSPPPPWPFGPHVAGCGAQDDTHTPTRLDHGGSCFSKRFMNALECDPRPALFRKRAAPYCHSGAT